MKKIILIAAAIVIVLLLCSQITDTRELRFTAKCACCESYTPPLSKEEYDHMEKIGVSFSARFSKRLFGKAEMTGEISYDGKVFKILECQPSDGSWVLVLWQEGDPPERCSYLTIDSDFKRFYLIYRETLWFGPADTHEALTESLNAFGRT